MPLDRVWFFYLFVSKQAQICPKQGIVRTIDLILIEDEIHFLFNCSKYPLIRNNFYNKVKILISNTTQLPVNYQWTDEHI